ncbi:MAG: hypothetical protein ABI665_25820 [Vicinamibacterales bacterium]
MNRGVPTTGLIALLAIVGLAGCEAAKSANPLAPTVAGPIPGVAITAPTPLEPSTGSQLVAAGQLVTLLIENPSTTGARPLWLQLEMASDGDFKQIVHTADRLTPGPDGRTSYRLPEPLAAATYYWRSRAQDGANTGPYSNVYQFSIVNPVVIDPPTPLEPAGNLTTNKPEFKARNGSVQNTSGVIYRFEISRSADAGGTLAVLTTLPGSNGTSSATMGELPYDTVFYWRAYATDQVRQSDYSAYVAFKTGPAPKPVAPPPSPTNPNVPLGPGGRTPNPNGGRLPLPNMASVVQSVAANYSSDLRNSCQDSGGSWAWMDRVVDTLRTYDTRWGYNGKRGNAGDPSKDVVDYNYGSGADEGTTNVYIIDVITGHCGATPSAGWGDVTDVTVNSGTIGRWISRGRF